MEAALRPDPLALARAYRNARYFVRLDGDCLRLTVGARAPDLEAYWPATRYALVTAWNPHSIERPPAANAEADAALRACIDALRLPCLRAGASAPDGSWPEDGWLVADIDADAACALARRFGQAGLLAWAAGEPVRLHMLMRAPAHAPALPAVAWVE